MASSLLLYYGLIISIMIALAIAAVITVKRIKSWHKRTLDGTVLEARESTRRLSEARITQLAANQEAFYQLNEQRNNIVSFMVKAYEAEIELGHHANRPYDEIVIAYLKQERRYTQQKKGD